MDKVKHIICYSGGHSSARVAIEVINKYGVENCMLLNHDITERSEDQDIKRFKNEIAEYLGISITYANMIGWQDKDQFDVAIEEKAFKAIGIPALCTNRMKTRPFMKFLKEEFPDKNCVLYYGFDKDETDRMERRTRILGEAGYKVDYPLATWEESIESTSEIGIEPPMSYSNFKHANCTGCLKAGAQHWYIVYCTRPDIFQKAKETEDIIGYTIIKKMSLTDYEETFEKMKRLGVEPTEHVPFQTFWARVRRVIKEDEIAKFDLEVEAMPCMCTT